MGFSVSCEDIGENDIDTIRIVGQWLDITTCDSCYIFEFDNTDNLIIELINENTYDSLHYWMQDSDSIHLSNNGVNRVYEIQFYSNDSIRINGFSLFYAHVFNYTLLKRLDL